MKKITGDVVKELKDLGEETGKELVKQTGKIVAGVITGKELVGEAKEMAPEEIEAKQQQDEAQTGRDIERELKELRANKGQEKDEQEEQFLAKIEAERQAEQAERDQIIASMSGGSRPKRGLPVRGKPSGDKTTATGEFAKKPD